MHSRQFNVVVWAAVLASAFMAACAWASEARRGPPPSPVRPVLPALSEEAADATPAPSPSESLRGPVPDPSPAFSMQEPAPPPGPAFPPRREGVEAAGRLIPGAI